MATDTSINYPGVNYTPKEQTTTPPVSPAPTSEPAPTGLPSASVAPPVDTSQPNPATVNATPYTSSAFYLPETPQQGFAAQTIFNDKGEGLSMDQYLAQGGAKDFSNVKKVSALEQGLAAAKASGQAPQSKGEANPLIQKFTPPTPPSTANIDAQLAEDKGYQQLLADKTEYNNVLNQSKSLLDTYNQAVADAGIPGINAELLNAKNIIDGTEDDIRNEVRAVNGFATDSQVLALAGARNKQLIKNYNNLLDTKKMAMENINNMVSLSSQDREFAVSNALQKLNIDQQINDYRDKFVSNAKEAYANVVNAIGYKGLLESLQNSGDPNAISLAEKTLGFSPGQLQQIVTSQQTQSNLKALADYTVTTPYIITASGEVQNSATGEAYSDPQQFQQATGMTLDQAGKKGLIKPLGLSKKDTQQQFENTNTLAKLAIDKAQLEVSQYNAQTSRINANAPDKSVVDLGNGNKIVVTKDKQGNIINQQPITTPQAAVGPEQLAAAQGNIQLGTDLLKNLAHPTSVGVGANNLTRDFLVNPFSSKKADFIAGVQQLTSQLTLDSLIKAKAAGATFGALSEGELNILAGSATKLNSWAIKDKQGNVTGYNTSGDSFKKEIDKINNFAKLDYVLKGGNPQDVGVQQESDGSLTTLGSDGKVQQIYP